MYVTRPSPGAHTSGVFICAGSRRQQHLRNEARAGKGGRNPLRSRLDFSNLGPVIALGEPTDAERAAIEYHDAKVAEKKRKQHGQGRIDRAEVRARCERALKRGLLTDQHCINGSREWAVIGGGPSINNDVDKIRALKRRGVCIVSVNKSHDWLLEHGIVPWGHVLLDPKEWVAAYVKQPRLDVRYFIASQCHDSVFDKFDGYPVFLWHAGQEFPEDGVIEPNHYLQTHAKGQWRVVGGKTTVGLRVPHLGHHIPGEGFQGADVFHMFGMDSSRAPTGEMHGYAKPEPPDAPIGADFIPYKGKTYKFKTNAHMARQREDLGTLLDELPAGYERGIIRKGFRLKFYGSGALPFYAAMLGLHADPECNKDPTKVGGYVAITDKHGNDLANRTPTRITKLADEVKELMLQK